LVLLETGLLHQPVGEPAQQLGLWPPALEAPRPQPHLVGEELGDPALADPVENEERLAVIAVHDRRAAMGAGLDLTKPAAPSRRLAGLAGARQILGHRVTPALLGQLRLEALLIDIAGRLGRQDLAQRRAEEAHRRAEARARRFEEGAAIAHIAHDILDIRLRDDAAP